jgi:hypothetical protein
MRAAARTLYRRAGLRSCGVEPCCLRFRRVDYDEQLIWMPLDGDAGSLPKPGLSDRRAP